MSTAPLSILCVTRADPASREYLSAMVRLAAALEAECVIVADGAAAGLRLLDWQVAAPPVQVVHSAGYIESVLDEAIARTTRRFILRLDDDEACSPAMFAWLRDCAYLAADHWKFPRQHIWPADQRYAILTPHLFPDHQTRLSTRAKSGGRPGVHCGSPFGGGEEAPVAIWHYKFLKSYGERLRIARRYDAYCPGYGTGNMAPFSLPEDAYDGGRVHIAPVWNGRMPWDTTDRMEATMSREEVAP